MIAILWLFPSQVLAMRLDWTDMAPEVLQKILIHATATSFNGPPKEWFNLVLTCRYFRDCLSCNSGQLSSTIFAQKFDIAAPVRRLGEAAVRSTAKLEMQRRFGAMGIFRNRRLDDASLTEAFWIAFLMWEDSGGSQKNIKQLLNAGLSSFLELFLRERLYLGADTNNGWPFANERNSLAVALLWLTASLTSINAEGPGVRDKVQELLSPFIFAPFRYPTSFEPEYLFGPTDDEGMPRTSTTVHGQYPPIYPPPVVVVYFGNNNRKARIPCASLYATLLYFIRAETHGFDVASPRECLRRSQVSGHTTGVYIDDIEDFHNHCHTTFADFPAIDNGVQPNSLNLSLHDVLCQPSYQLGTLSGLWQGSTIVPFYTYYNDWKSQLKAPSNFRATGRRPLYLTLKEHYTSDINNVVPQDDAANGMQNAWLPKNCRATETPTGLYLSDTGGTFNTHYDTFQSGQGQRKQVVDVIITGKLDDRHPTAWAPMNILGRVRLRDGLIVLSVDFDPAFGESHLLRGYATSSRNLVGRFRCPSSGFEPAAWDGIFSLSRDHGNDSSTSAVAS